jgi:hypothetical protein
MSSKSLFDSKCGELADYFMEDYAEGTPEQRDVLAVAIQTAVEDFFESLDRKW